MRWSRPSDTRERWYCVGMAEVPAMLSISPQKCRVSAHQGLLALVLTENTALFTAISNDVGYPAAFRRQVEAMVRNDDLVIGLSTSGSSPNMIEAIRAAKQLGAKTVALLGAHGELADVADIAIRIPSQSVPRIQEPHMLIGHLICEIAQRMTTGDYQTRFAASAVQS